MVVRPQSLCMKENNWRQQYCLQYNKTAQFASWNLSEGLKTVSLFLQFPQHASKSKLQVKVLYGCSSCAMTTKTACLPRYNGFRLSKSRALQDHSVDNTWLFNFLFILPKHQWQKCNTSERFCFDLSLASYF